MKKGDKPLPPAMLFVAGTFVVSLFVSIGVMASVIDPTPSILPYRDWFIGSFSILFVIGVVGIIWQWRAWVAYFRDTPAESQPVASGTSRTMGVIMVGGGTLLLLVNLFALATGGARILGLVFAGVLMFRGMLICSETRSASHRS